MTTRRARVHKVDRGVWMASVYDRYPIGTSPLVWRKYVGSRYFANHAEALRWATGQEVTS